MKSQILLALVAGVTAQSSINSALFNNIVRYTTYSSAAYSEDCPSPPYGSTIVQVFNDSATDTRATLFRDNSARQIILSFRGSVTPGNLDTDLLFSLVNVNIQGINCAGCKVHSAFQSTYNKIANSVSSSVASQVRSSGYSLIVTGHSLGAALASLSGAALKGQGLNPTVYTYGEPRNGDSRFASYVDSILPNYYRVTHYNDGVPQIPPAILGFQHHGTEYFESRQSGNDAGSTLNCGKGEPTSCNSAQDYGSNPINGAHIAYSNSLTSNTLFNAACGWRN